MNSEISEVTIIPIKPNKGLVAIASCVVDKKIYIGSLGLYTKKDGSGYRITYPNKKVGEKSAINIYHPITKELGDAILDEVVKKYEEIVGVSLEIVSE